MSTKNYDLSTGNSWHGQEVVGEFAYKKTINQLRKSLKITEGKEGFFTAELIPEPDNPHSPQGQAISVRWKGKVIGYLPETDAARYQQIRRIVASGITPTCSGRLWYYKDGTNTFRYYISLALAAPSEIFPLNDPPHEDWVLLPHGRASQVTKESDYLDVLLDYVPPSGMGMLLVTLHIVTRGVKSKYEGIEVHLDGACIGELTKQTSAKFINAVRYYDDLGLTTTAKAWIKGSSLAAEVTIQAAQSHELSEQDLQPKVSPLPRLIQYSDDPLNYPVPDAYSRPEDHDIQHQILDNKGKKYKGLPATSHLYSKFDKYSQDTERDKQLYPPKKNPSASYQLFTKENISKQDLFEAWMNVRDKKRVLLWIGVVFASLSVLSGIGNLSADVPGGLGSIFIGAGAGLLCGRALYCHSQDKKSIAEWKKQQETNAELKQSLMDSDPLIAAGLSSSPPPQPKPRRWKIVGTLAVILVVTGFVLLSSSEATTSSTAPRAITGFQQL